MTLPWETHGQLQERNWRHCVTGPELISSPNRKGILKKKSVCKKCSDRGLVLALHVLTHGLLVCAAVLSFTNKVTQWSSSVDVYPSCYEEDGFPISNFVPRVSLLPCLPLSCTSGGEEERPWQYSDFIDSGGIEFLFPGKESWVLEHRTEIIQSWEFFIQRKGVFKVRQKKTTLTGLYLHILTRIICATKKRWFSTLSSSIAANITFFTVTAHFIHFTWNVFPWTAISALLGQQLPSTVFVNPFKRQLQTNNNVARVGNSLSTKILCVGRCFRKKQISDTVLLMRTVLATPGAEVTCVRFALSPFFNS